MPSRRRRVREALARALAPVSDVAGVLEAADAVLRTALDAEGSAWGTVDPATTLNTSCARFGELDTGRAGGAEAAARERRLFELEWADDDPHTFWDLTRNRMAAAGLRVRIPDPRGVRRYDELLRPLGVQDELRIRLVVDGQDWATAILYRFQPRPFTPEDVAVAAAAAPSIGAAVRTALLQAVCDSPVLETPPGTLLIAPDGGVLVSSAAADELLGGLPQTQVSSVLTSLATATHARGAAALTVATPAAVLSLHGSPAKGAAGCIAAVVEAPRPIQLAPLIMRAFGFTARERQVTEALLQGVSRTQLARRLHMSEHTVGDHLKNVYRKAGVNGRAELAALLWGRYYEPLRSAGLPPSPYGHFVGSVAEADRLATR